MTIPIVKLNRQNVGRIMVKGFEEYCKNNQGGNELIVESRD